MSYGVTIQVSFPHKCGKFNWCRALNVEVMATFLDISPFHYLHDPGVFHRPLLSSVGSYIRYSWGAFAPPGSPVDGLASLFSSDLLFLILVRLWVILTSSLLSLNPRVRVWLTHVWDFDHPRVGPMGLWISSDHLLPQKSYNKKL